jgi:NAD(P)-dependent dehydrogenase (short-subunit alcohol dehydrogenase family)
MGTLDGKVAVITGAGSGIGAAMARAMATEGATVVLSDISGAEETVAGEIGGDASAVHADVSKEDDVRALIDGTVERHGRIDVLCNNAGIDGTITPFAELTLESYDEVIGINLRGVFLGMRFALPHMIRAGRGSIINTASVAAFVAFEGAAPYCAAKAGVMGLTRAAALDHSRSGVRINAICPGVIRTAILDDLKANAPQLFEQVVSGAQQMSAAKRIAEPEEVAAAAVFLAGDGASFVTGSGLVVDGGWMAM